MESLVPFLPSPFLRFLAHEGGIAESPQVAALSSLLEDSLAAEFLWFPLSHPVPSSQQVTWPHSTSGSLTAD